MVFTPPASQVHQVSFQTMSDGGKSDSPSLTSELHDKLTTLRQLPKGAARRLIRLPQTDTKTKWFCADASSTKPAFTIREEDDGFSVRRINPASGHSDRKQETEIFRLVWDERKVSESMIIFGDGAESFKGQLKSFLEKKGLFNKDFYFTAAGQTLYWTKVWNYDTAAQETCHWHCMSKQSKSPLASTERMLGSKDGSQDDSECFPLYLNDSNTSALAMIIITQETLMRWQQKTK